MLYGLLKTAHLVSLAVWLAGLVGVAQAGLAGIADGALLRDRLRSANLGLGIALLLGFTLAVQGHWFRWGWLQAKLVGVTSLVAIHAVWIARAHLRATGAALSPGVERALAWATVAILAVTVALAGTKSL